MFNISCPKCINIKCENCEIKKDIDINIPLFNENIGIKIDDENIILIDEIEHDIFKRINKYDIETKLNISFEESISGFEKNIKFLDNTILDISYQSKKQIKNGYKFLYKNKGMKDDEKTGDLYINIIVNDISEKNLLNIKNILNIEHKKIKKNNKLELIKN